MAKKSIRLQHAEQMRILFEYLDPKGDDIACLAQDEGDAVWKRWVKPTLNSGSKKLGTVVSYLTTFEKFPTYVPTHVTTSLGQHFILILLIFATSPARKDDGLL